MQNNIGIQLIGFRSIESRLITPFSPNNNVPIELTSAESHEPIIAQNWESVIKLRTYIRVPPRGTESKGWSSARRVFPPTLIPWPLLTSVDPGWNERVTEAEGRTLENMCDSGMGVCFVAAVVLQPLTQECWQVLVHYYVLEAYPTERKINSRVSESTG